MLREVFVITTVFAYFNWIKKVIVERDASDWVSMNMLSQYGVNRTLHWVVFYLRKPSPIQENYEIEDIKIMTIVRILEEWRVGLVSAKSPVLVLFNNKNLEYFILNKNLNRWQARLPVYLFSFQFQIVSQPGKNNIKQNTLTKQFENLTSNTDLWYCNLLRVIRPHNIMCLWSETPRCQGLKPFKKTLKEDIATDNWPK